MISYKPVAIQSVSPILTFRDILGEKIRGNYLSFGLSIQAEDLVLMTMQPPQIYIEKGQYDSIMAEHKMINNNSLKIEMINQLINRIMFFGTTDFTYQDEVFVSSILNKLGIKDTAGFMAWVKIYGEKAEGITSLLRAYRDAQREASRDAGRSGEILNHLREHITIQTEGTDKGKFPYGGIFHRLNVLRLWEDIYCHMPGNKGAAALHMLSDSLALEKFRENLMPIKAPDWQLQEGIYDTAVSYLTLVLADHKAGENKLTGLYGGAVLMNILQKAVYEQHGNRVWQDYTPYILELYQDTAHEYTSDTLNLINMLQEKNLFGEAALLPEDKGKGDRFVEQYLERALIDSHQMIRIYGDAIKLYQDEEKLVRAWSKIFRNMDMNEGGAEYTLQSYVRQICLMLSDNDNLKQQTAIAHRCRFFSDSYHIDVLLNNLEELQAEEKVLLGMMKNDVTDNVVTFAVPDDDKDPMSYSEENNVKVRSSIEKKDIPILFEHIMPEKGKMTPEYRQYLEWLNKKNVRINGRFHQEKKALMPRPVMKTDKKRVIESIRGSLEDPDKMQEMLKEIQRKGSSTSVPRISREAELLLRLADEPTRIRYEKMLGVKAEGAPIAEDETPYIDELNKIMGRFQAEEERTSTEKEFLREERHAGNNVFLQETIPHIAQIIENVKEREEEIRKASKYDVILREQAQRTFVVTRKEAAERLAEIVRTFGVNRTVSGNSFDMGYEAYENQKTVLVHKRMESTVPISAYGRSRTEDTIDGADKKISRQIQDIYKRAESAAQDQHPGKAETGMEIIEFTGAQKAQISEIVRSNINTQLGTLSNRVYQKLDRRLRDERKRKGY